MLLNEVINSEPGCADYKVALFTESHRRQQRKQVAEIFLEISKWQLPPDLIAVGAWRGLHIGRRSRRRSASIWTQEVIAQRLREKGLSKDEAAGYALEYEQGNEEVQKWVDEVLGHFRSDNQDQRQCCVSKLFKHIKKQMSYYWRQQSGYKRAGTLIRELVMRSREKIAQSSAEPAV